MNSWIVLKDGTGERRDFKTDASLRRYCMSKGALEGWRKIYDKSSPHFGLFTCVYSLDDIYSNVVLEVEE
mgnify:FL=1